MEVAPYVLAVQEVAQKVGIGTPTLDVISALVQHVDSNIGRASSPHKAGPNAVH